MDGEWSILVNFHVVIIYATPGFPLLKWLQYNKKIITL